MISDRWSAHFVWRGEGPLGDDERRKLEAFVQKAHHQQKRIRFWAIPDSPAGWKVMLDAGVDLINTDDLPGMNQFLRQESNPVPVSKD